MKRVITYGTFDLFHVGHTRLLRRARSLGDELIVAVSTDDFNEIKGKTSINSHEDRKEILESIKYVSSVISENDWDQKINDIIDLNIDIFVIGEDWLGKFDYLKPYCEVVYLPRTENISTSQIKQSVQTQK